MARRAGPPNRRGWQRGFLGYYALAVVDREPIYAFQLAARIGERTQGAWQPSPGSIYPAFRSLAARGLVTSERREGQVIFRITPAGRRRLAAQRAERRRWAERFGSSWRLMLDVVEPSERASMGLRRLRAALQIVESLAFDPDLEVPAPDRSRLQRAVREELAGARLRWRSPARGAPRRRARTPGARSRAEAAK